MTRGQPRHRLTLNDVPAIHGRASHAPLPMRNECAGDRSPHGFTLLELLVTVGVISLLAMIALPSYHQAQMRAKIAASKNNLRLIAQGLEVYRVDNNHYPRPMANADGGDPFGVVASSSLSGLTTPVAYINPDGLRDHFGLIQAQVSIGQPAAPPDDPFRPPTQDAISAPESQFNLSQSLLYFYYPALAEQLGAGQLKRECFAIISVGPDRKDSFIVYYPFPTALPLSAADYGIRRIEDTVYDPTNGAVSGGDLAAFGPEAHTPPLVGGGGN